MRYIGADREVTMRAIVAATLAAAWLAAVPMRATAGDFAEAERMAREAARQMLEALNAAIGAIPQYEVPRLLENGDIVIRRKRPEEAPEQGGPEGPPVPWHGRGDATETRA